MKSRQGFAVLTALSMIVIIFTLVTVQLLRMRQNLNLGHFQRERTKKLFLAKSVAAELLLELRETTNLPADIERQDGDYMVSGTSETLAGNDDIIVLTGAAHSRGNPDNRMTFSRIERRVNRHAARLFVAAPEGERPANTLPTVLTNNGPGTPWVRIPAIAFQNSSGEKVYPRNVATFAADWMSSLYAIVPREPGNPSAGGLILRIIEQEQEVSTGRWEVFGRLALDLGSLGPVASDGLNFYVSSGEGVDRVHVVRSSAPDVLEPVVSPGGPIDSMFISTEIQADGTPVLVANIEGQLVYLASPNSWSALPAAPNMVLDEGAIMTVQPGSGPLDKTGGSASAIFGLRILDGVDSIFRFETGEWKMQDPLDDYYMDGDILKRNDSYASGASDISVDPKSGAVFVELDSAGREAILYPLFAQNPVENVPLDFYLLPEATENPTAARFSGTVNAPETIASGGEVEAGQIIFVSAGSY